MTELLIRLFIKDPDDIKNPSTRRRYGIMAGGVGIACNILLTVFKIAMGIITGSVSIMGDAVNNLSDAVSSIATMIGFRLSGKSADKEHPYGHGRLEYVTGFVISAAVIAVAINLFKTSVENIIHRTELDVDWLTVIILCVAILVKMWMALFYRKISVKISSTAMRATATDSMADCVTTSVALISTLVMLIGGINIDGIAGALVALLVTVSGIRAALESLTPLLGPGPNPEVTAAIKRILEGHPEILGSHDLRVHEYGPDKSIASMHVAMPAEYTLLQAHELAECIEEEIVESGVVAEITLHIDPVVKDDEELNAWTLRINETLSSMDGSITVHDIRMHGSKNGKKRLIFEVTAPYDYRKSDEDLREDIIKHLEKFGTDVEIHIIVDRG